jgi:hypothetical protein
MISWIIFGLGGGGSGGEGKTFHARMKGFEKIKFLWSAPKRVKQM